MIDHDEAMLRASARADGELDPALADELAEHLAWCADCSAYADALPRLSALTAALPRLAPSGTLPARVAAALRRRRRTWRRALLSGGVVTATALAVTAVPVLMPEPPLERVTRFALPEAGAAEPLLRLRTAYVEREVSTNRPGRPPEVVRQRVWLRAPADVRIEQRPVRNGVEGPATVTVRRPGVEAVTGQDGRTTVSHVPPTADLPEPFSVTVATLGRDSGPGPVVAGRPTRVYTLERLGEVRVAYVDTQRGALLAGEDRVVLAKLTVEPTGTVVRKRTTAVRYDVPVDDALFAVPASTPTRTDPRPVDAADVTPAPARLPAGFDLVYAAREGPAGYLLFARGALPVVVSVRAPSRGDELRLQETPTSVGGRPAVLRSSLYGAPQLAFDVDGVTVRVSAPLPLDALRTLAERMYFPTG